MFDAVAQLDIRWGVSVLDNNHLPIRLKLQEISIEVSVQIGGTQVIVGAFWFFVRQ